jgi:hypothetical protein
LALSVTTASAATAAATGTDPIINPYGATSKADNPGLLVAKYTDGATNSFAMFNVKLFADIVSGKGNTNNVIFQMVNKDAAKTLTAKLEVTGIKYKVNVYLGTKSVIVSPAELDFKRDTEINVVFCLMQAKVIQYGLNKANADATCTQWEKPNTDAAHINIEKVVLGSDNENKLRLNGCFTAMKEQRIVITTGVAAAAKDVTTNIDDAVKTSLVKKGTCNAAAMAVGARCTKCPDAKLCFLIPYFATSYLCQCAKDKQAANEYCIKDEADPFASSGPPGNAKKPDSAGVTIKSNHLYQFMLSGLLAMLLAAAK